MSKANKVIAAATIGAAGVLALGACSSGASQDAITESPSQAETSRDAAAKPSQSTTLTGKLADVKFTYAAGVKCVEHEIAHENQQTFECSNIRLADGPNAVLVELPTDTYKVGVIDKDGNEPKAMSVMRDADGKVVLEVKNRHSAIYDGNTVKSAIRGWTVGVGTTWNSPASAYITVIKTS